MGTTTVSASATNVAGTASTTFDVTVTDRAAPSITSPGPVTVNASSPSGAVVVYPAFSVDDNCPGVKVSSSPKPGSTFAIGDTRVTGTATDASGNTTTASFIVHVNGAAAQLTQLLDLGRRSRTGNAPVRHRRRRPAPTGQGQQNGCLRCTRCLHPLDESPDRQEDPDRCGRPPDRRRPTNSSSDWLSISERR